MSPAFQCTKRSTAYLRDSMPQRDGRMRLDFTGGCLAGPPDQWEQQQPSSGRAPNDILGREYPPGYARIS